MLSSLSQPIKSSSSSLPSSASSSVASSPTSDLQDQFEDQFQLQLRLHRSDSQSSGTSDILFSNYHHQNEHSSSNNRSNGNRTQKMPRESQRLAEEEARNYYLNKMDDYLTNNFEDVCRNMFEMKQKHVEVRFEAMDILRKKSQQMANTWKLERDINEHYSCFMARLRKRNSLSNSEA